MVVGAILIVSIVGGGWYYLNRPPSAPSGEFAVANARYLEAASSIPAAADSVYRLLDVDRFSNIVLPSINVMNAELRVFKRLEKSESGDAQQIAGDAARSAALGVNAAIAFRIALGKTRVDDAVSARRQLATAVKELTREAKRWKQL
jgi:hypothetical protein